MVAFCACWLVGPSSARAEDGTPQDSLPNEVRETHKEPILRDFFRDEKTMWTSPFRGSSYSTRTFSKYVVPFTIITGVLIATDRKTADVLPNTADQARWSLRTSQFGASYTLAGIAGGMYLIGWSTRDKKSRETGLLSAEALAHSQLITLGLKVITQRERPADYHGGGTAFWRGGGSFPSGHSSGSFAVATVFAYEYGRDHRWVPYVSYGLASVVAASRLSGQRHWGSDIFVGSTMGFLVGRFVYKHHHDYKIDGASQSKLERLIPSVGLARNGFSASWQLGQPR
jgi:membrane-associated phospholipid phosphatase